MKNISSLEQIEEVLESAGYETIRNNEGVVMKIGGKSIPFTSVFTIDKGQNQVIINCQIARMGDIKEEEMSNVLFTLLDYNTMIRPYAFAIISATEDPDLDDEEKWPIVLTDSLPLGDLSDQEILASVESLWSALSVVPVLLKASVIC
ncbi:MAG: hypothetical protein HOG03_20720 [Desulfobacula sp.]|jgi:hypothetical protein|uniref:hypothetical protein n=1 Tax=Desulfobacula sp. TaxID=2593537 RepID=UPI001DAAD696|nr:hypothetical protein [Desulfobacula sp.]MBT3487123.1 hypothetical protein [Desulfobacula sp.]MBT3806994.1 hypothetical protein [Desulfobacula sp.]MBT4027058.1 hypothetical protein [Desulfobacula sp.]MBT4199421.1 hypothetical protein [Desulfobacula sp.]